MFCFHKWIDVLFEGQTGFLRKCSKCKCREAKKWITISVMNFNFASDSLIISLRKKRLFMIWNKINF